MLNDSLRGKTWLVGESLTIADLSVGGLVPSAQTLGLALAQYPEVVRWYEGLAALPAWKQALAAQRAAAGRGLPIIDEKGDINPTVDGSRCVPKN